MKRILLALAGLALCSSAWAFEPPSIGDEAAIVEGRQVYGARVQAVPPATQTIASGAQIQFDACNTVKRVTAAGAVSTSTSCPFAPAPSSQTNGCVMEVTNVGANTITIKAGSCFSSVSGADVSLAAGSVLCVESTAALYHQCAAVVAQSTPTPTPTPTATATPTNTATPTATPTP